MGQNELELESYDQDMRTVLEHLLQRREAEKAIGILRRPTVSQELWYTFAPALFRLAPQGAVDAWIAAHPSLDPRRLLPALLRAGEAGAPQGLRAAALRYVEHAVEALGCEDAALHNLAVVLLAAEEDEARLLAYLGAARDPLGTPLYDPHFALRVATEGGRQRACIELLCELHLWEDAVARALKLDREAASAVAGRVEGDEPLQRRLWLAIARSLIADLPPEEGVAAVNEVLKEAGGKVRIEDVLPLFPDFVTIDAFKAAICASLEGYHAEIERLQAEMADSSRISDALRKDILALEKRQATVDVATPCTRCRRPLGGLPAPCPGLPPPGKGAVPRLFVFATGNAFHGLCLAAEALLTANPAQRKTITTLLTRLSQVPPGQASAPPHNGQPAEPVSGLVRGLEAEIAAEDPHNGETAIGRLLAQPFIEDDELEEVAAWTI